MKIKSFKVMSFSGMPIAGLIIIIMLFVSSSGCIQTSQGVASSERLSETDGSATFTDSLNNNITLLHPAHRIVCQNSRIIELFIILGAGDSIIGAPDNIVNDQLLNKSLPNARAIGPSHQVLNIEKIVSLKPDAIILFSKNIPRNIDQLTQANSTLIYLDGYILQNLSADARKIGKITETNNKTEKYAQFIEKYLSLIDTRLSESSDTEKPRVYIEYYNPFAALSQYHPGNDVITRLHAENIAANISSSQTQTNQVNSEWVIQQDPDVILYYVDLQETRSGMELIREEIGNRPGFSNISAVKNNQVYVLRADALSSPKCIIGALYLAKIFHPDIFEDINPQEVLAEYAQEFLPGSEKIEMYYPVKI